jgi:hypothetical protein
MNPAPDAELVSVGEFYHNWVSEAVTKLIFKRLSQPAHKAEYRWDGLLNPLPERLDAVASASEQAGRTISPSSEKKASKSRGAQK